MNKIYSLILIALFFQFQIATAATDLQCQKDFGQNLSSCTQSIDTQSVDPKLRSEVHKACVNDAKAAKVTCLAGVNQCVLTCDSSRNTAVTTCQTTYNPAECGGNLICEEILAQQRNDCIAEADSTLISCKASCQL